MKNIIKPSENETINISVMVIPFALQILLFSCIISFNYGKAKS